GGADLIPKSEQQISLISSAVAKIGGLYRGWAQANDAQYGVIQALYALYFQSPVTQKQISEDCQMPKQTLNNVIRQLKSKGLIALRESAGDRRLREIVLTSAGEEYAQKTLEPFFTLNRKVLERLGDGFVDSLVRSLIAFTDAMEMEMELINVASKWEGKLTEDGVTNEQ
ncbi:MAG: MarR family transcriptional regulator, partial [Bifidobacteriaceae bacterium]|nr:MarR family transcriptional regulator [Bifidobacteriaceae bacterium]